MADYQTNTKLSRNEWISDPEVPDPDNLPQPLGWNLLVRPYPVKEETKSGIIMASESIDTMSQFLNIGRVVSIGPCCWNRMDQRNKEGEKFNWVNEGDFVSWPRNVGSKRKFKGVSYVILADDEVTEMLPDPIVFDGDTEQINIPESHLEKYNTVYNPKKG